MQHPTILAALTAALASMPSAQAAMYTKSSPVLQVNARTFDSLIAKSNHTSIVEFYAPWCGHCQNLKPAYEKAASNLEGLAKVAAVDCDDDANKQLCAAQGVQGFPTIKTFRPGKKPGRPVVEDYKGPRTATSITEEVVNKINNHVTKLTDKDVDAFVEAEGAKALLFTDKGTTSALLRSIAIDFLDVIKVGQIRNKEKSAVEKFGIEKFPTLVLIPGAGAEPVVYSGELKKGDMVDFLKQAGEPNPDPAPAKSKGDKKKKKGEEKSSSSKPAEEQSSTTTTAEPETSPEPSTADATAEEAAPSVIPITTISSYDQLVEHCFQPKSHTCLLANVPSDASETGDKAIATLSELNTKYIRNKRHAIPSYAVPADVEGTSALRTALDLKGDVEIIALNARRQWWRQYEGDFSVESVEAWLDGIRLGQGDKKILPKTLVSKAKTSSVVEEATSEETKATEATDPTPEEETAAPEAEDDKIVHEEL